MSEKAEKKQQQAEMKKIQIPLLLPEAVAFTEAAGFSMLLNILRQVPAAGLPSGF